MFEVLLQLIGLAVLANPQSLMEGTEIFVVRAIAWLG